MKILEKNVRLSKSVLWQLQYDAYCQFGIEAWHKQGVPSYITSNAYTATNYARLVFAYFRDLSINNALDKNKPIYLFDLGAGTGRFAYFFLKELTCCLKASELKEIEICYVMTDIAKSNLDFWEQHPLLKTYFEAGIIDSSLYHHSQTTPIYLNKRKKILSKEAIFNPIVMIGAYFFDTIPQDLFRYKEGILEEGHITLSVKDEEINLSNPLIINELKYSYSYSPKKTKRYYESPLFNTLLEAYAENFDGVPFLFPIGAFQVLTTFIELSQSRLCLIASDQAVCTEDQIREQGEPKLSLHGSFSLSVNYQVILAFFQDKITNVEPPLGGLTLLTPYCDPAFAVISCVLGKAKDTFKETTKAFKDYIENFEPLDYFKLISLVEAQNDNPSLELMLLLIKLGHFDPSVFLSFYPVIREKLPSLSPSQKQLLFKTIQDVFETFYPIEPTSGDFILNLGVLLFEMNFIKEAEIFFLHSIAISGVNPIALKNIQVCQKLLS